MNNITYAVVGDQFGYWQFFPATGHDVKNWGILPVWGFADVIASNADGVPVGERLFGYFPPATYLKMKPTSVSKLRWIDGAEHRAPLPSGFNAYRRVLAEANYHKAMDDYRSLLFPLHVTSYCLYDDLTQIDASKPTVIVNMSGNGEVLGRLHKHLGDNMKFCSNVGFTHWEDGGLGPDFIQQRSEMFFAPAHIQKRIKDWGPEVFEQKTTAFMQSTIQRSASWLKLTELNGLNGLAEVYQDVCEGKVNPEAGLIVKM